MSPIISFPTTLFTSSIIVLISFSISQVQVQVQCIDPSPNYSILKTACNDTELIDFNVCLHILQSTPKVASAKGLRNISIAIIESGISSSTNTLTYIKKATHPGVKKGAFNDCKSAHDQVVERFSDALRGVKAYDYNFPSYLLLTASTDLIKLCDKALAERNVKDEVISRGNQVVAIFGLSAFYCVNQLYYQ